MSSPARRTDRPPGVRESVPLARYCWFGVGGPADLLAEPGDEAALSALLTSWSGLSCPVIGAGSNLLVRDGGLAGPLVRLGAHFGDIVLHDAAAGGAVELTLGAGVRLARLVAFAADHGLSGVEFLEGVPGSAGGAVAMNAGCYGCEMAGVLVSVRLVLPGGAVVEEGVDTLAMGYRSCRLPAGSVVSGCRLRLLATEPARVRARMGELRERRLRSQPRGVRTGGSTFRNPPDGPAAWQLIAEAGCRGWRRGGARLSEQHCNYLINDGTASAADLEDLAGSVRERVRAHSRVDLDWEIVRLGQRERNG